MTEYKKSRDTLNGYMAEAAAFEQHVERALGAQIDRHGDHPEVIHRLTQIRATVAGHAEDLERLLKLHDASTGPLKRATTTALGLAAGVVDRFREEGLARNLRDDYVAAGMGAISYVMLYTTAVGLGDDEVAELAQGFLEDYAEITMTLHNLMPSAVLGLLAEEGHEVDEGSLEEVARTLENVWRTTSERVPEADEVRA